MDLCEPAAHESSSEDTLVNPSPPDPPLEWEGNFLSLRERIKPALREIEGVRVGIFILEDKDTMPACKNFRHLFIVNCAIGIRASL